jgi:DNA-binding NtrC family response regulator
MKSPLRILHLEDDFSDAEHVRPALESQGVNCAIRRIQTHDDLVSALERGDIDLVLSNFSLSGGDRLSVSEVLRSRWPTIPLILVFGSLDEELINCRLAEDWRDRLDTKRASLLAGSGGAPRHARSRRTF